MRTRLEDLAREQAETRTARDDEGRALAAIEQDVRAAERHLAETGAALAGTTARRDALAAERDTEQAALDAERRQLAVTLRGAYVLGRADTLKLVLNQEDPAQLGRALGYARALARQRSTAIAILDQRLAALASLDARIAGEEAALGVLRASQVRERETLRARQSQRQAVLAQIETRLATQGRTIEGLRANERALGELLERLRAALAQASPPAAEFAGQKGRLPWPVAGQTLARYGATRVSGQPWRGLLIAAREGAPVQAVAAGTVAFAGWLRGFGELLILDHGAGYMSLYGFNRELLRAPGERVPAGALLAHAGASGGQAQSALYFELRANGEPVDPAPWFTARR